MRYNHIILGGTFDRLHKGHKMFISKALKSARKVTIGLTVDGYDNKKILSTIIEPYSKRKKNLNNYVKSINFEGLLKIIPLSDIYGNSLQEKKIDAIFVTSAGYQNAVIINNKRTELNLPKIDIVKVPLLKDQDDIIISSTRIRCGEIDKDGNIFDNYFRSAVNFKIDDQLRQDLKEPFGRIIRNLDTTPEVKNKFIIAVGDITVARLIDHGIEPNISIYDLRNERKTITDKKIISLLPRAIERIDNKAGTISRNAVIVIEKLIHQAIIDKQKYAIKVFGEEDLLTLPSILFAPLNSLVFYGLKDIGMGVVIVDEKVKEKIIKKFIIKLS